LSSDKRKRRHTLRGKNMLYVYLPLPLAVKSHLLYTKKKEEKRRKKYKADLKEA
jgi:hypothetical protein